MNRTATTPALLAALVAVGCGGGEKKPEPADPVSGTGIPITAEPSFDLPPDDHKWPATLKRAKCIVVPDADEGVRDDELRAFSAGFQDMFFGKKSPFVKVDADALSKAAERRQLMGNMPVGAALSQLATKEGVDYAVRTFFTMKVRPRSDTGRSDVDSEIVATSEVTLCGSGQGNKKAQEIPGSPPGHDQLTSTNKKAEMRLAHARVCGKVAAMAMLTKLYKDLSESTSETWIDLTLVGFQANVKNIIKNEVLPGMGVNVDDLEEKSANDGSGQVTFRIYSKKTINAFQTEFEGAMEEQGFRCSTNCSGQQIVATKK